MNVQKSRWSKVYESSEEELVQLLSGKNIPAERWEAEAGETFDPHSHSYHKRLWCAEGSIVFTVTEDTERSIRLQAGDRLDLPANTTHSAVAGLQGCACYEQRLTDED